MSNIILTINQDKEISENQKEILKSTNRKNIACNAILNYDVNGEILTITLKSI